MSISVQRADFDAGAEIAALSEGREDIGAVASFVGLVRGAEKVLSKDGSGDTPRSFESVSGKSTFRTANPASHVAAMALEHYPGMTEKALAEIVAEAESRWHLCAVRVIHRIGRLLPGERIVFVGVAAAHRGDAFAACEFIMDYLKTRAPFWKKEETPQGARWVDARDDDETAAARWRG
ncbi:MAG: molybdopterin synthase catalytic subunit MoaE [Rugosibacter sp.]